MDHYDEHYLEKPSDPVVAELEKTKEELKTAKDLAMQSWLDSRPTIDKLERLQSRLASAKNSSSMSNIVLTELESELQSTISSIKAHKEEELIATATIDETTLAIDQTRQEIDTTKQITDQERRSRIKLKQDLRLKKQTLRTLQLTLRALRMESEAYSASAEKALHHISCAETDSISLQFQFQFPQEAHEEQDSPVKALQQINDEDDNAVQLTIEDYHALQRKAKEETSLAKWRVSVSLEQKLAAQESLNLALERLKEVEGGKRWSSRRYEEVTVRGSEELEGSTEVEEAKASRVSGRGTEFPKARRDQTVKSDGGSRRQFRGNKRRVVKKKKPFILRQISSLILSIKRLFR